METGADVRAIESAASCARSAAPGRAGATGGVEPDIAGEADAAFGGNLKRMEPSGIDARDRTMTTSLSNPHGAENALDHRGRAIMRVREAEARVARQVMIAAASEAAGDGRRAKQAWEMAKLLRVSLAMAELWLTVERTRDDADGA